MTVREALAEAAGALEQAGVPSPAVDAEWLLAHTLGVRRSELYGADLDGRLDDFRELVRRRAAREPLAYVLGEWGFRGLTLVVDPRVLIPRPETETVVERCLTLLVDVAEPAIMDVGVGSGAIALALADERPDAVVVGTDASAAALEVAEENRRRTGFDERVRLVYGDLLAGETGPFDLVVSNPPYVAPDELPRLEPELQHEPREALVGAGRELPIARAANGALGAGGALVLEVGDGRACDVAATLVALGYADVKVSNDLTGRQRVVDGRRR
ncbi:MAG TPA: peptide chain release factor N(5)-glutamine methyltransferase [Gaiellaceae bacterium]|nr:peptide chain release factor N(5)-glutamine methyltransferase [Gaiellaceae bacterium]